MKWIGPLFKNAGGWSAYVSYQDDMWFIDRENPIVIGEGKSGIMLLPMMEEDYGVSYKHQIEILKSSLELNSQDAERADSFPFHVPVLTAFQHMSGWTKIAVNWVQYIELYMDRAQILFDSCQSNNIDHLSRHKTLRFVNRWAKREGFVFVRN